MVTTCRLLCALLVLALCCCPSVCGTEGSDKLTQFVQNSDRQPGISGTDGGQKDKNEGPGPGVVTTTDQDNGKVEEKTVPKANENANSQDASGASVQSAKTSAADKSATISKVDSTVQKTTTTTNAPTTTTTTTTTTAPEAPLNTAMNTEAPTTTTTRAPSRLREVDGSLSSSAWVCAPLVLAVSALVYTTVN
ncbi:mucin TcMUCII [Trypanosoma cruzi Dm28c]|uniref:Mucin TcMUCII n=2 Tax=Trypanosoma cruzi TaxID=5693 RepID=V5AMJ3_TRYCR|nr:mucin TcMUCII [Trypanosoma cruzi Dm28c]PBJ71292.1 mucin TcMUCII [Trypanosoma cruzi cruzi]PBJ78405.1 mucin TcMUCII [Trypanosoma cruzi cruzi]PWU93784.1 putative mucin TcMUCII [Trypanosoma cruzi]PWU93792.1 putative mucin TcMUCII [Trypanosoma cruzi]